MHRNLPISSLCVVVTGVVVDVVCNVVDDLRLAFTLNFLRNVVVGFLLLSVIVGYVVDVIDDGDDEDDNDEEGLVRRLYLTVDDFVVVLSVVG